MSPTEITRAWKDCVFREHLTDSERGAAGASRWRIGGTAASAGRPDDAGSHTRDHEHGVL